MKQRRESPVKRVNARGHVSWMARYTDRKGRRRSAGTFKLKREAQAAIDAAYGRSEATGAFGDYFETWPERHPRSKRTNKTNKERIRSVLGVEIEGVELRDWLIVDLRRKHALVLVDVMLREHGRATTGAAGVLRSLSALAEDAITDEEAEVNVFRGIKVRGNDPRATKHPREIRVWSWEQMHEFARAAGKARTTKAVDRKGRPLPDRGPCPMDQWRPVYAEAMVRVFCDSMCRLGEVLPLERVDLAEGILTMRKTAWEGETQGGTKHDHLKGQLSGEHAAPCPPTLEGMILGLPRRLDTRLMFPTPTGRLWRERNFYRDVWSPAQELSGMDIRPHEMRHSAISLLRAAGIDEADLADMAGHGLATMRARYTHPLRESFDAVREAIG